jgi:hypothetical protein
VSDRERAIGAAVSLLRDAMPQQAVADAMRDRGHRWTQSTVWAVEKGERRLLLSEAADLAAVLGVSLEMLLKRPDEAGLQRDIANECRAVGLLYDEAVRAIFDLTAAHRALQGLLAEAERKSVTPPLVTAAALRDVKQLTARSAFEEVSALDDLDDEDRPQTREDFEVMRGLNRG